MCAHTHTVYSLINTLDCDDNRTLTWTDCHLSHWVNSHFVLLYLLITELQGCLTLYLFIFIIKKDVVYAKVSFFFSMSHA